MVLELTRKEIEKWRDEYPDFVREAVAISRGDYESVRVEKPSLRKAYYSLHHWKRRVSHAFSKCEEHMKYLEEQRRLPIPNIPITPLRFSLVA